MQSGDSYETYSVPPTPPPPPPTLIEQPMVSPSVAYTLIGITVLVYLLQLGTEVLLGTDIPAVLGMKVNQYIIRGDLWRLLTPMFLHGSILHIGFNMYALLVIGAPMERRFGHLRFLALYLCGSFAGNVVSFLLSPNPSLGASTAIFGLLGAEMVFLYRHREIFGGRARAALQNVITVAAINFFIGLSPGIDNWGHLGGLLGGLIFTWFGGPILKVAGAYPVFQLEDERDTGSAIQAGALVLAVFGLLAGLKIFGVGPF